MPILPTREQTQDVVTRSTAFLLLLLIQLLWVGCAERAEPRTTDFSPQTTRLPAHGASPVWDADEDMPVVMVKINGEGPYRFMIDTGASHVLVDKRLAERLHLPRHGNAAALRTAANADVDTEQPAIITTLDIGDAHFSDFNVHVFDFTRMEIDGDLPIAIDGILGAALFSQVLLTIDYPNRSIHIANGSLPEVDGSTIVPLTLNTYVPFALLRLETRDQTQERWAMIDTGSGGSLGVGTEWGLTYSTVTIDGGVSMTASGLVSDQHARIERMRLGDLTFIGPEVEIRADQRNPRIGQKLLQDLRLTLDLAGRRARFESTKRTIALGPSRSYGFTARPSRRPGREGFIVNWIASDSPAAKVLQLGDRLVTVNGQSTAHMSNRTFVDLKLQAPALSLVPSSIPQPVSFAVFDQLPWTPHDGHPGAAPERSRAFALYTLGCSYFNGFGVPKDEAKALLCYQQAAELHDAGAQNLLGALMVQGRLLPKNPAATLDMFRKAAEQGYPEAQCNLGRMYGEGKGVPKDEAQAFAWFRKAAEQNYLDGQILVGQMYGYGIGVAKDETQAFTWYRRAAEQNSAGAQRTLGWIYFNGRGVPPDEKKAVEWYRKAAEQNDAAAQTSLAWMYGNGRGVPRDDAACVLWYSKAAEQGDANAQSALGWIHANGRGVPQDQKMAFEWHHKAAEQGHASSQNDIGRMLTTGLGTPKDESAAAGWFRKAAEQGHADAQKNLAIAYLSGVGVPTDYRQALVWFTKAAEQGHAEAQNNLGIHYANGLGVEKDLTQARAWFLKAAEQGNRDAQANLGMLFADGQGGEKNVVQARKWLQAAAKQGHLKAQVMLDSLAKPEATPP